MTNTKIGFVGFGLIGGSIARAMRISSPHIQIHVYTRRKNPDLETGVQEGVIDRLLYQIDDRFSDFDIIFLCAPVLTNIEMLRKLKPFIHENCIITDVGSVKGNMHEEAVRLGMERNFIGGHPMAGSEKTGYANSSATLLENCYYLLTPTGQTEEANLDRLKAVLSCTKSNFVVLDPKLHDTITAAISHVPHIIAAALVNMVQNNEDENEYMKSFAAGGFKDITRIASSSPEMWESICLSNKNSICALLDQLETILQEIQTAIKEENSEAVLAFFKSAGDYRNSMTKNINN